MMFVTAKMEFVLCMNCVGSPGATLGSFSFFWHGCPAAPVERN